MVKEALAAGKSEKEIEEILVRDYGMTVSDALLTIDIETGRRPDGTVVTVGEAEHPRPHEQA